MAEITPNDHLRRLRLGIVGVGKIARDQHLPAIAASSDFELVAAASRHSRLEHVPSFDDVESMLANGPPIDVVSICTPPAGRHLIARAAIAAGKHVMLEKPPGTTVCEVAALIRLAESACVTLFASWHSREAAGVDAARTWLVDRRIDGCTISWREDIRVWHPGQEWILRPGGFGVFDPGINALSIATAVLPDDLLLDGGTIRVPANRASPIAATIGMRMGNGAPVTLDLDFLQSGPQSWDITVQTDLGTLLLKEGGRRLFIDGLEQSLDNDAGEYPRLYRRFADLTRKRAIDVDLRPLQLVADAFLICERSVTDQFHF